MKKVFLTTAAVLTAFSVVHAADGLTPVDGNGKPLNLDFEAGTIQGWVAEGTAFDKQPIRGDTVAKRRSDMKSRHAGEFWIGSYEVAGDAPQGRLTSVPFKVTQPFASFLLGGGSHAGTRVEIVRADTRTVAFKTSGSDSENMRPVVVDLREHLGKEVFIRLIDEESGGWGHINFDDFKLYAERPKFSDELTPQVAKAGSAPASDLIKFDGLSPEDAAKAITMPPGFKATLFAGEPDVQQPISFAIDDRGRLWVAEGYTYPNRAPEGQGRDRILVFEDTDGDGKFNRRTVFIEKLNLVSGIEVGFGGVWVGAAPYLMFIPIADGDEPKPAGEPKILLDGWAYQDTHETLNTFKWGPDGWLYGCHGVFTHSNVGKPGAKDDERTRINAGIWRYHPTKHIFEVFAEGTSNPWGIDFDENGQLIEEACVIPHLFHMIQGARYQRQAGQHFNPYTYDDIKTIADHLHYAGNQWNQADISRSTDLGGGHAHCGLMIYQGDNWPAEFRGKVFMGNIHGACINMDVLERKGSGFVGHHAPNPILFNDKWSQIVNFMEGSDGAVYFIDWYDKNQCHSNDPNQHDRSNGRIFRISYGDLKGKPVDLKKKTDEELIQLAMAGNGWAGRHARRILQERAQTDAQLPGKVSTRVAAGKPDQELRALWTASVVGADTANALRSGNEFNRAWAIQLLCEGKKVSPANLKEFVRLAREDKSPIVRLYLASAMQRLPIQDRWDVLEALSQRGEDAKDHNIPLMVWYAAEPLPTQDIERALKLAEAAKLPNILNFMTRRTAALNTPQAFAAVTKSLLRVNDDARRLDILNGLSAGLKGQRQVKMPEGWAEVETKFASGNNAEIRALVQSLSLTFGSANALAQLRQTLMDKSADAAARKTAFDSLMGAKDAGLPPLLRQLLNDPALRGAALRGLGSFDDPATPAAILALYPSLNDANKRDARNTLAARPSFALALLTAVEKNQVPRTDLTADLIQQLRNLKNAEIDASLQKVWGVARDSNTDKLAEIEKYKAIYRAGGSQPGDASRGRAVFAKVCYQCHTLFGTGGKVGPDLTGSNRGDLDYILQNMVDPNAVLPNDYLAWNIDTKDDRTITGLMREQTDTAITVATANEVITLARNEIATMHQSKLSMMPDGLLTPLTDQEVRDLIIYLRQPTQVPFAATPDTVSLFFNGKDLSNWDGNPEVWRVENGEIVGESKTGLKHNEFLKSQFVLTDFRLVFQMKLTPNNANSGVQFRSEPFEAYEMKGCQADAGAGWWGKLYEENGRELLSNKPGDAFVKTNDWNTYEIVAVGSKIRTAINGNLCTDLDDPLVARRGIIGLQVHSGGPTEVRFKDFHLELNPKFELATRK
ncbi:MAG TPA: PVC-type heme-binding CxxCH protein [Verrucomicrobiae bacterium]|nr:PVC-type heme-binding CxxCH protein [Verrucomicrobiae bacterium]